jgi:peptidoglycan/xylan/chitin deacetylase (PgdA/CDA1 family)
MRRKHILICFFIFGIIKSIFSQSFNPGIILTFDDNTVDEWYNLLPILDQYNAKVTFFVSDLEWYYDEEMQKLTEMYNSGHEIGGHGYWHIDVPKYLKSHTDEEYINIEILPLLNLFSPYSIEISTFAYPHGHSNSYTDALLLNYFQILRGVSQTPDYIDVKDKEDCYIDPFENNDYSVIYGAGIDHSYDRDYNELTEAILKAKNENLILVLFAHKPSDDGEDYTTRPSFIDSLLNYVYSLEMSFYKVNDLISLMNDWPLPIGLTSFTAKAGDRHVLLNWSTASEIDNQGFEILRSTKRKSNYQMLDSYIDNNNLEGAGNTPIGQNYSFIDNSVLNGITYWYKLIDVAINGVRTSHGPIYAEPQLDGYQVQGDLPTEFALQQNYPNPFNPSTKIKYDLAKPGTVIIELFNTRGQKIETLLHKFMPIGYHEIEFNAMNLPSAVYFYRIQQGDFHDTKKMVLMR